jgi:hypothetical protein
MNVIQRSGISCNATIRVLCKISDSRVGASKSEVLRAGLKALESMSEKQLREVVGGLRKVKTGGLVAK